MGSFITYAMLAYLAVRLADRRWRRPAVLLAVAAVVLIGLSRIYLGVHYVSDVIAGYAAGAAWVSVCVTGSEAARRWYHARRDVAVEPQEQRSSQ
jgi:undecaprenyl-diphosphatase